MQPDPSRCTDSWREAVAFYDRLLAEGDPSPRFLLPQVERVGAGPLATAFRAHPNESALVIAWSERDTPDGAEPVVVLWADDEWPEFEVELWGREDGDKLEAWVCDEEDLPGVLEEVLDRLRELSARRPARGG